MKSSRTIPHSGFLKGLLGSLVLALLIVSHIGFQGISLQSVQALSAFNTHSKDFQTLRSSNYTLHPDSTEHWDTLTDADSGDVVSFAVYYHNSSEEVAENTRISLSVPTFAGTEISAKASLSADNFASSKGNTTIRISNTETLTYIPGSAKWYPNQSQTPSPFPFGQSGDEVIAEGVNIGEIPSGWESQGSVVARFQVSKTVILPPQGGEATLDVTANGAQGPLVINQGDPFTVEWISSNVGAVCTLSVAGIVDSSGVASNASLGPILASDPEYYPQPGEPRIFTVTCTDLSNNPISDSVEVSVLEETPTPLPPIAPTLLASSPVCGGEINLSWNAVGGATSYKLFRDGAQIATSTTTNYVDSVQSETMHSYTVQAVNDAGASAHSGAANVVASSECQVPQATVDITANGLQGPVILTQGEAFTVEWISSNVGAACTLSVSGAGSTGVVSNGSLGGQVTPGDAYYPPAGGERTFTILCESIHGGSVSDSVVVKAPAPVLPPVPTGLVASTGPECGGIITLSWNATANTSSYKVFRNGTLIAEGVTSTSYTDTGLTPGTSHSYTVRASNDTGDSVASASASATSSAACIVPPSAPTLSAQTGPSCGGNVSLSWNTVANATSYKVYRGVDVIATTTDTTYADSGLTPGGHYTYTVKALNSAGESPAAAAVSTTASEKCPSAPKSSVDITANGSQGPVNLSDGESFTVEWVSSNVESVCTLAISEFSSVGVASNGSLTHAVTPADPYYPPAGGERTFTITCDGNNGPVTDSVTVKRAQVEAPQAPVLNSSTGSCGGNINLSWNSVSRATSYKIFRDGVQIAEVSGTTYADSGLTFGKTYTYSVKASNAGGDSPLSNYKTETASSACVEAPSKPKITVQTGPSCGGTITISWNKVNRADSYEIYRNTLFVGTTTDLSFIDTGLTPGVNYTYTVKAIGAGGTSPHSASASATSSAACIVPPSAPTLSAQTGPSCGGNVSLSWNTVANATSYKVYRGVDVIATTTDTTYADSGLTYGTTYTYTVKSSNSAGDSAPSPAVAVKASEKCPLPPGPEVTLTANPSTIDKGQNSTLTWTSNNTDSCSATWTTATSTDGNQLVNPETTTTYSITCVRGERSATDTATVTVKTGPQCVAPSITSSLAVSGKVGTAFSYTISATGTSPISYSVATSSLPAGLTFSGNTISGTPTVDGTFTITLTASNQCGSDGEDLVITITKGGGGTDPKPTVSLTANPSTIDKGQNSTLTWTSNNTESCSAVWTSATSTSGSMVVSPATTTTYSITCEKDGKTATDTATVTVNLPQPCTIPALTSATTVQGKVGVAFSYTFTASSSAASTLSFIVGTSSLPAGLSFSGNTISGTPTASGTFTIPVTVTDNCGTSFDNEIVITIDPSGGGGTPDPTVDLSADPDSIRRGNSSTLSWTSNNADSCSASWTSATSTSGTATVSPDSTTTYSITCVRGSKTASDSTTVTVRTSSGGGGGGSRRNPPVLGEVASCEYLRDYLHINWVNDPVEVIKLQVFLKELEGFDDLQITRVFDQQTFDAVAEFQVRYQPDILTPWGYREGEYTGFVYILTKKKVNEIFCQRAFPLNTAQEIEIDEFRVFLESLRAQGVSLPGTELPTSGGVGAIPGVSVGTTSTSTLGSSLEDLLGGLGNETPSESEGGLLNNANVRAIAAAVFAGPQGWDESLESLLIFFLVLAALIGASRTLIAREQHVRTLSAEEVRMKRLSYMLIGLVLAVILCFAFSYYNIVLPLILLIVLLAGALLWFSLQKKTPRTLMTIEEPKKAEEGKH